MPTAIAVTSDLIFSTKISGTAAALGLEARTVSTPDALQAALSRGEAGLVMVDMSLPGDLGIRSVERAAAHPSRPTVLAFFSHVHGALGEAARRAGADPVMPRSRFSTELPALLQKYCLSIQSDAVSGRGTAGTNPAARSGDALGES